MKKNKQNPEKLREIFMPVTKEVVNEFSLDPEKISWRNIGNRKYRVLAVEGTEEVYSAFTTPIWAEQKRKKREKRCQVRGKTGRLISCPDNRRCETCKAYLNGTAVEGSPVSLEALAEREAEPAAPGSMEDDIAVEADLERIIATLKTVDPLYGVVFQMLFDEYDPDEIAEDLRLDPETVDSYIGDVRQIAQVIWA